MKTNKTRKAFTLVELLVVIAVLAILATVSVVGYSEFIKNAAISNDNHLMSQLNSYLDAYKVQNRVNVTAENVREITNKILQDGGVGSDLIPQSAKYGYHFYFNLEEGEYQLIRDDQAIQATSRIRALRSRSRVQTNNPQLVPEMSFTNLGLFFLDTSGSPLADAISSFYGITDKASYIKAYTAMQSLTTKDGASITGLSDFMDEIVVITGEGNLYAENASSSAVYFAPEVEKIGNSKFIWDGNAFVAGGAVSETNALVNLDAGQTITVPSSVMLVAPNALTVNPNTPNAQEQITINFDLPSVDQIASIVDINFTNATFAVVGNEQDKYVINGGTITKVGGEGDTIAVSVKNYVTDFDLTLATEESDLLKVISDYVYVSYELASIKLAVDNFVGSVDSNSLTSTAVAWTDDSDSVTVADDGTVTFTSIPTADVVITATATDRGQDSFAKSIKVHVVRPTYAEFELANSPYDTTVDEQNPVEEIQITYTGDTLNFPFSNFGVTCSTEGAVDCNKTISFTAGNGDAIFTIANNVLTLNENVGFEGKSQQFTVTVGNNVLSKTFNVTVNDVSAKPFAVKAPFNAPAFLYRVGNQNAFNLRVFFETEKADKTTKLTITDVEFDDPIGTDPNFTAIVSEHTYDESQGGWILTTSTESNKEAWKDITIQFTGTGVAKIQLEEVAVTVEVVDGKNAVTYADFANTNMVMLCDIAMPVRDYKPDVDGVQSYQTVEVNGTTLYGNGFTLDVTNGKNTAIDMQGNAYDSSNYRVRLNNGTLDNVKIVGSPFEGFGITRKEDYNICNVLASGNNRIINSFISYCAAPVRVMNGSLEMVNTTLLGGSIANLDIRGGHIVLDNVTTVNQRQVEGTAEIKGAPGFGIIIWYEKVESVATSITIKNNLTQYNWMTKEDFENIPFDLSGFISMETLYGFIQKHGQDFLYVDSSGVEWINAGIFSLTDVFTDANIKNKIDNSIYGYAAISDTYMGIQFNGCMYAVKKQHASLNPYLNDYTSAGQGSILPTFAFSLEDNYAEKTAGSNEACYMENGEVKISFDQGGSKEFSLTNIAKAYKQDENKSLTLANIYLDGVLLETTSVTFNATGEHVLTFEFDDKYNYQLDGSTVTTQHTYSVTIHVTAVKPAAKNAEFTFADTNTATEKITVGDKTYISAKDVTATDKEWGYITVSGQNIFYPITEAAFVKSWKGEYQVHYYVFKDAVTITDYADGGTGSSITYNDGTTKMPTGLSVVKGMEAKYTGISSACVNINSLNKDGPSGEVWDFSASSTVSETTTHNGYLAHSSPSGLSIKSGTRDYDAITVAQFSYTDEVGATYYYFVGYFMPNQVSSGSSSGGGGCFATGAMVTLADGSQKAIENVTFEDTLLAWDFFTGEYVQVPAGMVVYHGHNNYQVINLRFSNGSTTRVINEHGFFDLDENRFVYLGVENASLYIGHNFATSANNEPAVLVDVTITEEYTGNYSIVSALHYNAIVDGMLTNPPANYNGLSNWDFFNYYFEVGEDMMYNADQLAKDIETYGLYTYEEFAHIFTYEQFVALNIQYFKIPIVKGQMTYQDLMDAIQQQIIDGDVELN